MKNDETPQAEDDTVVIPGRVLWTRDYNLEAILRNFGVRWEYVSGIRLSTIKYGANKPRLEEKKSDAKIVDMGFKILELGLALPALLLASVGNSLSCLGGFHRSCACKEAAVGLVDGYVVYDASPQTLEKLSKVCNADEGDSSPPERRIADSLAGLIDRTGRGEKLDMTCEAKDLRVKETDLQLAYDAALFRKDMNSTHHLVVGGKDLSDIVVGKLQKAKKSLGTPIVIDTARLLARFSNPTGKMTDMVLAELRKMKTGGEVEQRNKLAELEDVLRQQLAAKKMEAQARGQAPLSTAKRINSDLLRLANNAALLSDPKSDIPDMYRDKETLAKFVPIAKTVREHLLKALKALGEYP